MKNGYENFEANIEDFKLHANLYFPEVRLRNFIEIRNHDCNKMPLAVLAIYKGILYNEKAMSDIEELFKLFTDKDFSELRYNIPKNGLLSNIKGHNVGEICKELLYIAERGLIDMRTNEEKFLEPIKELTLNGLCPADIIIRNWNGLWDKDVSKLVKYIENLTY